jgi:RimJ/RimL family protein N-acetyltransferase
MNIVTYHNRPSEFWALLGPYFARSEYRREMPYLKDDDGYVWFVVMDGGKLAGFASLHVDRRGGHLHGLYVVPDYRSQDIATRLVQARLDYLRELGNVHIVNVAGNPKSTPLLQKFGFRPQKQRGQYTMMEMAL